VRRSNLNSKPTATQALWSVGADIQACAALNQATLRALVVLSPALMSSDEASLEDEAMRAARIDPLATQRVLDILQDLSSRFERALIQADWEAELENAIIEAAARLPAVELRQSGGMREAC
jgi:ABC-type methionine transport system ATPase subunit